MIGTGARPGRALVPPAASMSPPSADMPYDMADRRMSSVNEGLSMPSALILRRLPLSTTPEAVKTMLLFAKDLQDTEMIANEYEEDKGYATALARFASMTGASEAQSMLNGRPNTEGQVNMIVEMLPSSIYHPGLRRNTIDPSASRPMPQAMSPRSRLNRYNVPFDNVHKRSPPPTTSSPEATISDASSSLSAMIQPQSPRGLSMHDRGRVSGKSVIGEEDGDEETNGLIKDPLRYMRKDNSSQRKSNAGHIPLTNSFTKLSLHTELPPQQQANYLSPRSSTQPYSPRTPFSPGNGTYMSAYNPQFSRTHQFPPVNPADQNPPCNTLYVGNLPMDTSEDELKAMFSKQRGYKRLCFRTKQNGPMCFVEFEDISFATKALNDLYGAQLHNSVKGGIRLSFSKNPLGVRSGQAGSMTGQSTPLSSPGSGPLNGLSAMSPGGFSTANGPPPGLSAPPGFPPSSSIFTSQYTGLNLRNTGHGSPGDGGMYPDYMMGR